MRVVLAAILIALLAVPAQARGKRQAQDQTQSAEQQKKARDADQAYKSALKSIPAQKPADPWNNMR